jgi:mRNA degradation ribonuclease J1/J2
MSKTEDIFSRVLQRWRTRLTEKEQRDYESTSLNVLKNSIIQIQNRLEATKDSQNMNRLRKFLEAMEQFGRVIELFANSSVYVAFIYGPVKFILMVSRCSS